jgi:hypothetical protein
MAKVLFIGTRARSAGSVRLMTSMESFADNKKGSLVSPLKYSFEMTTKRRKSIQSLVCPGCREIGTLRKIVYGMPDPESFDFEKYAMGGCCLNGDGSDPDLRCKSCDWEGLRESFVSHPQ